MSLSRCPIWAATAILAGLCPGLGNAQVLQAPGTMPGRHFHTPEPPPHQAPAEGISRPTAIVPQPGTPGQQPPIQTGTTAVAPALPPGLPPSLLDKPAGPARVTLNAGSLSVDANNSSLSDILKNIEGSTGMTVDGFDKDSRVFGIYGPGSPRDILSALLDGAGYNFLMVGSTSAGTPRAVVLTTRSNAPVAAPGPGGNAQPDEDDEPNYPPPMVDQPPMPVQAPPQANPPTDQRPRTPQEMLQELQRLRQQQQQPQPGQPNPQ